MIWTSRLLVPDARMPLWKRASARGLAKHQNLYTRIATDRQIDEIERWLNEEFETPAQAWIDRAVSDGRLTTKDWHHIIRFVAAQDVRTPARLHESMRRWQTNLQSTIEEVLEDSVKTFTAAKQTGASIDTTAYPHSDYFPVKISTDFLPGAEYGTLRVEAIAGRGLWLFSLKHLLTRTLHVLLKQKWTIFICPNNMKWLTSDDPVVKLNYNSAEDYNFGGGWGNPGTEIFMPLSPRHLLYTRVGFRSAIRGTVLSPELAQSFQQFTVQHAHRFVFSTEPDERLPEMRQRHVSAEDFNAEASQWRKWHDEQTRAEQDLRQGSASL